MLTKNAIHKCRPLYLLLALRIIHPKMPISGVIQLCFSWFCKNFVQLCVSFLLAEEAVLFSFN